MITVTLDISGGNNVATAVSEVLTLLSGVNSSKIVSIGAAADEADPAIESDSDDSASQ